MLTRKQCLWATAWLGVTLYTVQQILQYGYFWDLAVYEHAVSDLVAGRSPYQSQSEHLFVYHPMVLHALAALDSLGGLRLTLCLLYGVVLGLFARQVHTWMARDAGWLGLCALGLGGCGVLAMVTGNLTVYLHLLILTLALHEAAVDDGRAKRLLWMVLPVLAVIKPYLLAYLALPWLLQPGWRSLLGGVLSLLCFVGLWMLGARVWPAEYAQFLANLSVQTIKNQDLGYAVFGVVRPMVSSNVVAGVLHLTVSGCVLLCAVWWAPRRWRIEQDLTSRVLLAVPALIMLNPRMKEYDFAVALLCAVLWTWRMLFATDRVTVLQVALIIGLMPLLPMALPELTSHGPASLWSAKLWQLAAMGWMTGVLVWDREATHRSSFSRA